MEAVTVWRRVGRVAAWALGLILVAGLVAGLVAVAAVVARAAGWLP